MGDRKQKKIFSKKKAAGLLSLSVIMVAIGGTLAYYINSLSLENPLRTSYSGAAIVEEFDPNSSFLPGETAVKRVAFQNTGEMDVYLRVKVPPTEAWCDANGNPTKLDTAYVVLDSDGNPLKDKDGNEVKADMVTKNWTDYWKTDADQCQWTEVKADGYRYYKAILPAGEITNDILESITLAPVVSNDRHEADYSSKVYKLTFDAEAIPVEADGKQYGINTLWGMMAEEDSHGTLIWSEVN